VVSRKRSAHHYLTVRLQSHCTDCVVQARRGSEGRVQRSVAVEPREVVARRPVVAEEPPTHHQLAVRLHRQRVDRGSASEIIKASARVKREIETAIRVQSRNTLAGKSV